MPLRHAARQLRGRHFAHSGLSDAMFGALNSKTGGLKSQPVCLMACSAAQSLIKRVGRFSHAATDESTAGVVAMPRALSSGAFVLARNFAPLITIGLSHRPNYLCEAHDGGSFGGVV
jgi:hypothetical protein